jgi:hypothetical protein
VVLAVTARNFMSKTLDALDAEPDAALMQLEPELRAALVVGRPFRHVFDGSKRSVTVHIAKASPVMAHQPDQDLNDIG